MSRNATRHRCGTCGASAAKWSGRCPACGEWNTLVEHVAPGPRRDGADHHVIPAVSLLDLSAVPVTTLSTGLGEVDRVLAGGIVPGSTTLLAGPPGIGKSTLVLQLSSRLARAGHVVLYVAAEEAVTQVRRRAERLDAVASRLWMAGQGDMPSIRAQIGQVDPAVVVVDSVQSVFDPAIGSSPARCRRCGGAPPSSSPELGRTVGPWCWSGT